jgi:hypothetical protein
MTRKDYIKFAKILSQVKDADDRGEPVSTLWLCQVIAFTFKKDNPNFDGLKFSRACGYDCNITL